MLIEILPIILALILAISIPLYATPVPNTAAIPGPPTHVGVASSMSVTPRVPFCQAETSSFSKLGKRDLSCGAVGAIIAGAIVGVAVAIPCGL
jgi:hypothetical protein